MIPRKLQDWSIIKLEIQDKLTINKQEKEIVALRAALKSILSEACIYDGTPEIDSMAELARAALDKVQS